MTKTNQQTDAVSADAAADRFSSEDLGMMKRALVYARRGAGFTRPNPMVGAVVVKDGRIIGQGWHHAAGMAHAEVNALKSVSEDPRGSTMYVTLEPCNHHGRTPPCTNAIIEAGVAKVVAAMADPNKDVEGGGFAALGQAGIEVESGCLEHAAKELNRCWLHWMRHKRPYVAVKLALSQDSMIAEADGNSKWLSGARARWQVQRLRRFYGSVMVGASTVEKDNPRLDYRLGEQPQPLAIVIDPKLRTSPSRGLYKQTFVRRVMVAASESAPDEIRAALQRQGVEVLNVDYASGKLNLGQLLDELGRRGLQGVLCEGGGRLAASLLSQKLANRLLLYRVPKVIGPDGIPALDTAWSGLSEDSFNLELKRSRTVGQDVLNIYDVEYSGE